MDQKEMTTQIGKLLSDNPAKFIKIRDTFDEMFEGRTLNGAQSLSDLEYERLRKDSGISTSRLSGAPARKSSASYIRR